MVKIERFPTSQWIILQRTLFLLVNDFAILVFGLPAGSGVLRGAPNSPTFQSQPGSP